MTTQALTEAEVKQFVDDWYHCLDVHSPVAEILPLVATDGLKMVFPEATLTTVEDFKGWYHAVTHRFFDEIHTMKELNIRVNGAEADITLVVNWQAKIWDAPAPKSTWLGFDAYQTWQVHRDPATGRVVINLYVVDKLDPMPGSASL